MCPRRKWKFYFSNTNQSERSARFVLDWIKFRQRFYLIRLILASRNSLPALWKILRTIYNKWNYTTCVFLWIVKICSLSVMICWSKATEKYIYRRNFEILWRFSLRQEGPRMGPYWQQYRDTFIFSVLCNWLPRGTRYCQKLPGTCNKDRPHIKTCWFAFLIPVRVQCIEWLYHAYMCYAKCMSFDFQISWIKRRSRS